MALFRIINNINEDLLNEINCKLDKLLAELGVNGNAVIKKATADLDKSTNKLAEAVTKNTPSQNKPQK